MLTVLDARRPAVLVFTELSPGRSVTLTPPPLPDPRCVAVLGDSCVVADYAGGGLARWDLATASWTVTLAGMFARVTSIAADAAGRTLVADAAGVTRIGLDGSIEQLYSAGAGERCVGVSVAGDGRIAVTQNPARILVSEDDGATWLAFAGVTRPGAIAGLPTGFAVVDAAGRTVEVLRTDAPPVTIGAVDGLIAPLAVAPAPGGVVITDAATRRIRRFVLVAGVTVAAEFVDGVPVPFAPALFERVVALAAPMPTGVL